MSKSLLAWKVATFLSLGLAVFLAVHPIRKPATAASAGSGAVRGATGGGFAMPVPLGGGFAAAPTDDPGAAPMSLYVAKWTDRFRAETSDNRKCEALRHLAISSEESAVQLILETYRSAKRMQVRFCAVEALGEAGTSLAVNWLGEIARGTDKGLASSAVMAMASSDGDAAKSALLELAHGEDANLRRDALMAMGQAGWGEATPLILDAWTNGRGRDKMSLLASLGGSRDPAAIPFLMKLVQEGGRAGTNGMAFDVLGQIGGPEALAFLTKEAHGKNAAMALSALTQMSDEGAQKAIVELARTPGEAQSRALQEVMANAQAHEPRAVDDARTALLRMVREGGKDAAMALSTLSQDDSPESNRELLTLARGGGPQAREAILYLGNRDNPEAIRTLTDLAEGTSPHRGDALRALAAAGEPDAMPTFLRAVESRDSETRGAALEGLAQVGGPDADRALERAVQASDAQTRKQAAQALAMSGTPGAQAWLEKLAHDPDPDVASTVHRLSAHEREGEDGPPPSPDPCVRNEGSF